MTHKIVFSKLTFVILLFLAFAQTSKAQTGTIKGKIFDAKTNEPLIGASVLVTGTAIGAAADLDGNFVILNVPAGKQTLTASYVSYQSMTKSDVVMKNGQVLEIDFAMNADDFLLKEVEIVARANRESENILLMEQRQALVATQAVGARELSRKGIGDAQAAVAQVSGISRQEGVKNVFVRGLGDRYNATLFNGFPIPSEDPEYKNIALGFFGTDIIQSIGVNKVFKGSDYSDVGGAIIDIKAKELIGDYALNVDISGGMNSAVLGADFLRQSGSNVLGFANNNRPTNGTYNFSNSLDLSKLSFPMNHNIGISGGKMFRLGNNSNPLSIFAVLTHGTNYYYTKEIVRNTNTAGTVWQDQIGNKYAMTTNQLGLANVTYLLQNKHNLQYSMMMIHDNDQYVGEYSGYNSERHQDSPDNIGFLRRQQTNDNLLLVNQLLTNWTLAERLKLDAGVSYNTVKGLEPDRRENYLSQVEGNNYILTGSNRQKRFFSELRNHDINVKTDITYKLSDRYNSDNSALKIGYNGRFVDDKFESTEYNFTALNGIYTLDNLLLDNLYNQTNLANGEFSMTTGEPNSYHVTKYIHSAFAEASYRLLPDLSANVGVRMDFVDMVVNHRVQHVAPGKESIKKNYLLPSLNIKYDINSKNSLRLGASKTYTLPQSKEISPYQYVNISFASQGNPHLKPSHNYNIDLKWDFFISTAEVLSITGFYKHIVNPIGRVDEGNSAGLLTYNNIAGNAVVGGAEIEFRKNIFNQFNTSLERTNRLFVGFNASYIYTNTKLNIRDTEPRNSALEGASPFLANVDLSYNYSKRDKILTASLLFNYFSNRIYTIGAKTFKDIVEEGVPTLDFAASYKFNKHFGVKLNMSNLLNASYRLTRESSTTNKKELLNEFKKGQNISLGINYDF